MLVCKLPMHKKKKLAASLECLRTGVQHIRAQWITVHVVFYFRDANDDHLAGFPTSAACSRKHDGWPNTGLESGLRFGSCIPRHGCFHASSVPCLSPCLSTARLRSHSLNQLDFGVDRVRIWDPAMGQDMFYLHFFIY